MRGKWKLTHLKGVFCLLVQSKTIETKEKEEFEVHYIIWWDLCVFARARARAQTLNRFRFPLLLC